MALRRGAGLREALLARLLRAGAGAGRARGAAGAGLGELRADPDRFGGLWVRLAARPALDPAAFRSRLQAALELWRCEGRVAVWLQVPIPQSQCIGPASSLGFRYHHAEGDMATLSLWLAEGPSRLPAFASHQVGVAGAVFDEDSGKILVVQDRHQQVKHLWKFPGGLSEPGEDIGDTAVREVWEETGVQAEFRSLLSVRQQHCSPGAFGKSDLYLVCRLQPLTFALRPCPHECLRCQWMELAQLAATAPATPVTRSVARLLLHGHRQGFHTVDLTVQDVPALRPGPAPKLYHREVPA